MNVMVYPPLSSGRMSRGSTTLGWIKYGRFEDRDDVDWRRRCVFDDFTIWISLGSLLGSSEVDTWCGFNFWM